MQGSDQTKITSRADDKAIKSFTRYSLIQDLKNIMDELDPQGEARRSGGEIAGTIDYIAPEQTGVLYRKNALEKWNNPETHAVGELVRELVKINRPAAEALAPLVRPFGRFLYQYERFIKEIKTIKNENKLFFDRAVSHAFHRIRGNLYKLRDIIQKVSKDDFVWQTLSFGDVSRYFDAFWHVFKKHEPRLIKTFTSIPPKRKPTTPYSSEEVPLGDDDAYYLGREMIKSKYPHFYDIVSRENFSHFCESEEFNILNKNLMA